jgi:hypothetical protein
MIIGLKVVSIFELRVDFKVVLSVASIVVSKVDFYTVIMV